MRLSTPVLAALGAAAFLGVVTVAAPDASAAARRTAVMSGARGEATATPTSRARIVRGRRSTAIVGRTRQVAVVGRTRGARGAVILRRPRSAVVVRGRRSQSFVWRTRRGDHESSAWQSGHAPAAWPKHVSVGGT
jgi:hypothetical protein